MNKTGVIPIITVEDIAPYLVPNTAKPHQLPGTTSFENVNKAKQNMNCHATKTNSLLYQNA